MKRLFIFILFFFIGIMVVIGYGILKKNPGKPIDSIIQTVAKPDYDIANAPSNSLRGSIKAMSGEVFWQSRTATESSVINSLIPLQQGEELLTKENGAVLAEFPNALSISMGEKTQIDFVQTLPTEFVISIASGSASFKKLSDIPLSIRSYHLLIRQNEGEVSVKVDTDKGFTNFSVLNGSVTVGYNDLDLNSHVLDFKSPQKVSFNDATRTIEEE